MPTVNQYRIRCTTDAKDEFTWSETEPTTCPTNTAHTIDAAKTVIVDAVADNEVKIQEEQTKTGAHYQTRGIANSIPAVAEWHDFPDFSWPFPVSIFAATAYCRAEQDGDILEFLIGPDTTIGALTVDAAIGTTVLDVQQSVIDNTEVGYFIKLTDGINTDDCGRVLNVDKAGLKITVETATTNAFAAATPTYVQQTVKMLYDAEVSGGQRISLGEAKIGGSYIPANTALRLRYKNSTAAAKRFRFLMEYLY